MAKYTIEDTSLTNIADAIRAKTGDSETITVALMPAAIEAIQTGGGSADFPDIVISGKADYAFYNGHWDWIIEDYPDKITTADISSTFCVFAESGVTSIPFAINGFVPPWAPDYYTTPASLFSSAKKLEVVTEKNLAAFQGKLRACSCMFTNCQSLTTIPALEFSATLDSADCGYMFQNCYKLENIGAITNFHPNQVNYLFDGCYKLKDLPVFVNLDWSKITYSPMYLFQNCRSLRSIPSEVLSIASQDNCDSYLNMFAGCYALGEIKGLGVAATRHDNNMFGNSFQHCYRLQELTFATNNGTPLKAYWTNQVIDLSNYVGYAPDESFVTDTLYNNEDLKGYQVIVLSTYNMYRRSGNEYWFTTRPEYSRYGKDSAINTINSLPDTSIAAVSATNTIIFKSASGPSSSITDGTGTEANDIGSLSEDEIAVAAAKGWTVSLV